MDRFVFLSRNLFKMIGMLCGITCAVLFLTIGFWKTMFIVFFALIGGAVGSVFDTGRTFRGIIAKWASRVLNED